MPTFFGQLRSHLSPLLPPRRRPPLQKPSRSLCTERQRRASVAFPSRRRRRAPSSLSLKPPVPGAAGPARPSPHAPQTLSNPLGSRRLLREETLAAAGARAARLRAARRRRRRRRGARYGEPSNEARAGAQRRRVLAEHGRGAAAAVAAAAGAQGPLHHWQPWSPSIFLPRGRRLGSAHVLGGGRGRRRPSLPAGRAGRALEQRCVRASPSSSSSAAGSSSARRRCCSCCCSRGRAEGGPQAVAAATTAPFLGGVGGQTGLVQRLQPTPFKGTRGGVGRCRPTGRGSGWVPREGVGRRRGLWWLLLVLFSGSAVPPSLWRHRERRDQRPSAGGGGATASERRRRREGAEGGERREDGVCACAPAPQT